MRGVRVLLTVAAVALIAVPAMASARQQAVQRGLNQGGGRWDLRRSGPGRVSRTRSGPRARLARRVHAPRISGVAYYVSPSGSDSNSGTSPDQAWKTIGRVNSAQLRPGDGVLFEGGQSFSDQALMPGVSGTAAAPIVFGSYGSGQATITQGVWFVGLDYLTFDDLKLKAQSATGFQGGRDASSPANHIVLQRSTIDMGGSPNLGIFSYGNDWQIEDNTVQDTGDSGMLLNGDSYTISGNTIANTGVASSISYGKHGIYLKVSNATVTGNTITNFSADGISARYRNSTITQNNISHGAIGIAWFQYDTTAGTSHWTNNTITKTTDAGIYVSPSDQAGPTIESFIITGNTISTAGQKINVHSMHRVVLSHNR